MNRVEFLKELDRRLKLIPEEDRIDAICYYDEFIGESGLDENADVVALLGTPKEVAAKIIAECSVKHVTEPTEKKHVKRGATAVWLTILGIASLPISLPLAIVALVLAVVAVVVILAIGLSGVAVFIAGIITVIAAFFTFAIGETLYMVGMGLVASGVALLVIIGAYALGKLLVKGAAKLLSKTSKEE